MFAVVTPAVVAGRYSTVITCFFHLNLRAEVMTGRSESCQGTRRWRRSKFASDKAVTGEELTDKVPAGLRNVDHDRMQELSSATGTNGNEPCYGVLDFPDMKAARNHPAGVATVVSPTTAY